MFLFKFISVYVLLIINYFFFFVVMCGIISGICFIVLCDFDFFFRNIYFNGIMILYDFLFMMEWVFNFFCILEGFIFLCFLKMDYNDITEIGKYNFFM